MKRVFLITGANGHLGNTLVKSLLEKNEKVRGFVLENDNLMSLSGLDVDIVKGDICQKETLDKLFKGLDDVEIVLIHTAGIVSISSHYDPLVYKVNVLGTKNVIEKAIEYKVSKFIYISSVHAIKEEKKGTVIKETKAFDVDSVEGCYAKTKAEATKLVLDSVSKGLNAIVIHPSGIIGPNDFGKGHSTQLVVDFLESRLTAITDGGYDFVDVRDVAKGIIDAAERGKVGESYILSNRYYSVLELTNMLSEVSGKRRIKTKLPAWFVNFTAPLAELFYKTLKQTPLYTRYSIYTLFSNSSFSHKKADQDLGYKTRDMKETIKDTISFLTQAHRIKYSAKNKKH